MLKSTDTHIPTTHKLSRSKLYLKLCKIVWCRIVPFIYIPLHIPPPRSSKIPPAPTPCANPPLSLSHGKPIQATNLSDVPSLIWLVPVPKHLRRSGKSWLWSTKPPKFPHARAFVAKTSTLPFHLQTKTVSNA